MSIMVVVAVILVMELDIIFTKMVHDLLQVQMILVVVRIERDHMTGITMEHTELWQD